jgi:hypothetical protein
VLCERFDLDDEDRLLQVAQDSRAREGWDLVVCLTDLPRRSGLRPIVAEARVTDGVALASLPALGVRQVYRRLREMVLHLVVELALESLGRERVGQEPDTQPRSRLGTPIRRVVPSDADVDVRFVLPGIRGQARLLAGMVRDNRPWQLITGLSGSLAAALAAGAFAVAPPTSGSWPTPSARCGCPWPPCSRSGRWSHGSSSTTSCGSGRARLFNAATVLTVALGVGCLYVALLVATLAAAWFLVTGELLSQNLQHPVGWADYATIAWLASSIATLGGTLGSGLESDQAVRAAAYGYRQQERRGRAPTTD